MNYAEELIENLKALHKEFLIEQIKVSNEDVWAIKKVLADFENTVGVTYDERDDV